MSKTKSELITDTVVPVRHVAFIKVLPGYILNEGAVVYRVPAGTPFDPAESSGSRNNGKPRAIESVAEGMNPDVAASYDYYIEDRDATAQYLEELILAGTDIYSFEGKQYRPARLGEAHTLVVDKEGQPHPMRSPSRNRNVVTRHYVVRELQQPEEDVEIEQAIRQLATAITKKVRKEAAPTG